ncbi:hypothetical protein H9P43_006624 [Blastocladiella emersonii ATCC 22665]|nr:hypothetical protein H9P43_006624 [Blastocladiella emersonii ATCC 22665]
MVSTATAAAAALLDAVGVCIAVACLAPRPHRIRVSFRLVLLLSLGVLALLASGNALVIALCELLLGHVPPRAAIATRAVAVAVNCPLPAVVTVIALQRCATIVVAQPSVQKSMVRLATALGVVVGVMQWIGAAATFAEVAQKPEIATRTPLYPAWCVAASGVLPAAVLYASARSLAVAFEHLDLPDPLGSSSGNGSDPTTQFGSSAASSGATLTNPPPVGLITHHGGIRAPLTSTFRYLTLTFISLWTAYAIAEMVPGIPALLRTAVGMVASPASCVMELSFDHLFRRLRWKHRMRRAREAAANAAAKGAGVAIEIPSRTAVKVGSAGVHAAQQVAGTAAGQWKAAAASHGYPARTK